MRRLEPLAPPEPVVAGPAPLSDCRSRLAAQESLLLNKRSLLVEVVQASISRGAGRLLASDPGVRLGRDPEAIHQARVATRRLRSDLKTFSSLLSDDWVRGTRQELRWLGERLGEVRDLDVLSEGLGESARDLGEDGVALAVLLDDLAAARASSFATLRKSFSDGRYLSLLAGLCAAATSPPTVGGALRPAAEVAEELLARPWKRLHKAAASLGEVPSDTGLHAVRIKAKALRYACEAVGDVAPRQVAKLAKRAKALQTVLGEHHDAVALRSFLRKAAGRSQEHAYAAGLCLSLSLARDDRDAWRQQWRRLEEAKLSTWVD